MATKNAFVITNSGIQATIDFTPYVLRHDHPHYGAVEKIAKEALRLEASDPDAKEEIAALWDDFIAAYNGDTNSLGAKDLAKAVANMEGLKYEDGVMTFNGLEIHNAVVDVIRHTAAEGLPFDHLMNFLRRLMNNPSHRSVEQLWSFIEKNGLSVDEEGYILFYKVVRENFYDKHTGKFDNSPGMTIACPRNMVDDDPRAACSHGFHVGGWDYSGPTGTFKSRDTDKVVICKVDPADVVSVPYDANAGKCRICKYTVIQEYKERLVPGLSTADGNNERAESILNRQNNYGPRDSVDDELFDDEDDSEYEDLEDDEEINPEDLDVGDTIRFNYRGRVRRCVVNEVYHNAINGLLVAGDPSYEESNRLKSTYRNFNFDSMTDIETF